VLPACNSQAMQLHLNEIAITPGVRAILILDQAGWHGAKELGIPTDISLLPLPPRSPEHCCCFERSCALSRPSDLCGRSHENARLSTAPRRYVVDGYVYMIFRLPAHSQMSPGSNRFTFVRS